MRTVALVGNGLSISYNAELSIPRLTQDLLDSFREIGGELDSIAEGVSAESPTGFEDLLGPFDSVARLLEALPGVTGTRLGERMELLGRAAAVGRALYREGVSVALELIATRSHDRASDYGTIECFCQSLADLGEAQNLTVATLNYDGLLHSGFLKTYVDLRSKAQTLEISDMGDGRTRGTIEPDFAEGSSVGVTVLRSGPDFMDDRTWVLNLHGSLGWLRRGFDDYCKFKIEDLRKFDYWSKLRSGNTEWVPVVVLADQKDDVSNRYPFSVAYDAFRTQLITADRWLVAGYGLGDKPVNDTFRLATLARERASLEPPAVLVVGRGNRADLSRSVSEALGIKQAWINATGAGLPDALDSQEWADWAG